MPSTSTRPDESATTNELPSPRAGTPSGSRGAPDIDPDEERQSLIRGMSIAIVVWPAFTALDFFMCGLVSPAASIGRFVVYRVIGLLVFVVTYLAGRRGPMSMAAIDALHAVSFCCCAVLIALMSLELGELSSPYMHGVTIVVVVQAAVFPHRFGRGLWFALPVALSYPLVNGAAALFHPPLAAQWRDTSVLARFASNYVFVLSSAVIVAMVGHRLWAARWQLYKARRLGCYRLEAPIGKGGQNEVWLAWDERLRRDVALKLLRSQPGDNSDVKRFEREARAASRLTSPHAIRIFDFGASDDGIYYIAMEYLAGATLGQLVRDQGPMPPRRAIHFARQACLSLAEAHDAGIVHRDIKPDNLFATRVDDHWDTLKLLDFGIAREVAAGSDATLTDVGTIRGTPAFVAPEIYAGGAADARSDLYSLGATLYLLLTGEPPFSGKSGGELLIAHLSLPPVAPSVRRGSPLPDGIDAVVMRCLDKQPERRFQSARELFAELGDLAAASPWTPEDALDCWEEHVARGRRLLRAGPLGPELVV